jgi:hypothetical protein
VSLEQIGRWTLTELPRLNRAVLFEGAAPETLYAELRTEVLPGLPAPESLSPPEAMRMVVLLGFAGASVARHRQERDPACRAEPLRSFAELYAGPTGTPFPAYFARLADRTGTGHCHRDSYASLVRWNVGTVEVRWAGDVVAVLPGAFDDGIVRTYAGATGEERFFELVKKGEAIELAVNDMLAPVASGAVGFAGEEGLYRVRVATGLLDSLRLLFHEFVTLPPGEGMTPEYFMDVFRQFAVHWQPGDIPPSGALDPEAIKRDLLLGIAMDGYGRHVRRLFPALLDAERAELAELMDRLPLPLVLLRSLGLDPVTLAGLPDARLAGLCADQPALVAWYRLLAAHARASGAHLMVSKRFLFKPQAQRDAAGLGDAPLVSNRAGTTGMDESLLERLTRARKDHTLSCLHRVLVPPGPAAEPPEPVDLADLVRILPPGAVSPGALRPPAAAPVVR